MSVLYGEFCLLVLIALNRLEDVSTVNFSELEGQLRFVDIRRVSSREALFHADSIVFRVELAVLGDRLVV